MIGSPWRSGARFLSAKHQNIVPPLKHSNNITTLPVEPTSRLRTMNEQNINITSAPASAPVSVLVKDQPSAPQLATDSSQLSLVAAPVSDSQAAALVNARPVMDTLQPVALNSQAETDLPIIPGKRRRTGRIASLPKTQRDLVNRMLSNAIPHKNIVRALDELGYTVTEKNVSNWATGGYVDWTMEQYHVTQNRLHQDCLTDFMRRKDAPELAEIGLQAAATRASQVMLAKLARPDSLDVSEFGKMVDILCRLNRELGASQKQRDEAARSLGKAHDPVRVAQEETSAAIDMEHCYSRPSADLPQPAEPPFLPPPSTPAILEERDREQEEYQRAVNQGRILETLKLFSGGSKAKSKPTPESGPNGSTRTLAS
jgi:hypothetical protein